MVTMLDVAKRAGVSKSTVSRVLNSKNIVSKDVTAAVFRAIEETGYRPNLLARQLATRQTNLIGFVMTNSLYNGPYFSTLVYNGASFSEQHHHQLVLADGKHSAQDELNAIHFLLDMKCAGVIVYPQFLTAKQLSEVKQSSQTPIIVINRDIVGQTCITMDHYGCSEKLSEYILSQGHQRIAFIQGHPDSPSSLQRFAAFKAVLKAHQLEVNPNWVAQGDWSPESGYQAAQQLLAHRGEFTALIAGNDDMAIGAMKAFQQIGIRLPDELSIASFDNTVMGQFYTPALTSVKMPLEQMMQQAIRHLATREPLSSSPLLGQLIVRDSVQKPLNIAPNTKPSLQSS
ncbi:LacI family DNA-binding transcriptional regulator [Celerinatantimonas yamalensis]|uniref:LacI family DNA-binding transcriptional regulator n=1 Tax=Celerinatantimonas yamalensis TaxID=559956 RepID=A0ABW9G4Z5_9GAMM